MPQKAHISPPKKAKAKGGGMVITARDRLQFKIESYKRRKYKWLDLNPKQVEAMQELNQKYIKSLVFGGAAGGGKTWFGCEWLMWNCLAYPGTHWFMGRKEIKRLKGTTVRTFRKVCAKHGLVNGVDYKYAANSSTIYFKNPNPINPKNEWEGGSLIDLLGLKYKPSDSEYTELGSSEYTGGFIEEGGEVHFDAFDTLGSRVGRQLNDKYDLTGTILITCNPKRNFLYRDFYKPWREGLLPNHLAFIQSFVDDNPKGESGYKERLQALKNPTKRKRLLAGDWEYADDDTVLYQYDALTDMFTNTFIEGDGNKYITADIARKGSDRTAILVWNGTKVIDWHIGGKLLTTQSGRIIQDFAKRYKIPMSRVVADEDGVGGGVVDMLGCKGFINGSRPLNGENYANLKTQCAYIMAEEVNAGRVYWDLKERGSELEEAIIDELSVIRRDKIDDDRKLHINSKKEQKEALKDTDNAPSSPDIADAFIMRGYFVATEGSDVSDRIVNPPRPKTSTPKKTNLVKGQTKEVYIGGRKYIKRIR